MGTTGLSVIPLATDRRARQRLRDRFLSQEGPNQPEHIAFALAVRHVTAAGEDLHSRRPPHALLARNSAAVLILLPAAAAAVLWAHARLVMLRTTHLITWGTVVELTVIAPSLGAGIAFSSLPAAIVASASILAGRATMEAGRFVRAPTGHGRPLPSGLSVHG